MSVFGYQFEYPWALALLLLILPAYWILNYQARKRSLIPYPPLQYKSASLFPKVAFGLTSFCETLLLICLLVSLAKPYRSTETVFIEENGIDIILLVDISASMQAKDFDPNRLEATKTIVKDFVRRSGGHRVGIVVFAKHVFTLSPLTTDHLILKELIEGISLTSIDHVASGGTAIGDSMLRGTEIAQSVKIEGRDQIMILLTDGDNNTGAETELATKYALSYGLKIYTIGLGSTNEIQVVPDPDNPDWSFDSRLVEEPLKKIAQETGGQYFHAINNRILNEIFTEIAKLEQTPLKVDQLQQKKYFRYPVNLMLCFLFVVSIILRVLFLRRPLK